MCNIAREIEESYKLSGYESSDLSLREILYLIVGKHPGVKDPSYIVNEIMSLGSDMGFYNISAADLLSIDGIGESLATKISISFELGHRMQIQKYKKSNNLRSPQDIADYLYEYRFLNQEHFITLFLDTKNKVISEKIIFKGSLSATIVHPREIFREALRLSAASIVVAHNHPSGDPSPSTDDINVTKRLIEASKIIGVKLLDHIIVGNPGYASFIEKGLM